MAIILINGTECSIKEEYDLQFLKKLDDELSFKMPGVEYTPAFKGYYRGGQFIKWDGITRILTSRLTFPYGLLERVKNFYYSNNKSLDITDLRPEKSVINSINIIPRLKELGKVPYPYQLETIEKVKNKDSGIIRSATGSGKSVIAALITSYFNKKTIIYVIGVDLLHQMHKLFTSVFEQEIGIIGNGKCEVRDINIASVWTLAQALGVEKSAILLDNDEKEKELDSSKYKEVIDLLRTAKLHVWDECHQCAAPSLVEISKFINPEYNYGMSASPYRDDNSDLLIEGIFGAKIVDISASYLIENGFLVKPNIRFINLPKLDKTLPKQYQTIYKEYIIENDIRNQKIITGASRLVEQGYPTLVLYSKLNHGKKLFSEIKKNIPSMLLSGKDTSDTREKAKEDLESGKISCIVASTIFDIGVDLPSLSGLIIAGGGKSSVRACQRIGRVIRKYETDNFKKTSAAIIDFIDNAPYYLAQHSLIRYKVYSSEPAFNVHWPK